MLIFTCRSLRRFGAAVLIGVAAAGLSIDARAAEDSAPASPEADGAGEAASGLAFVYETAFSITGNDDANLRRLIEESSQLAAREDNPTATYTGLVRRAEADMDRLRTVLRSEGYYDGAVSFEIDRTSTPATVSVEVEPRTQYTLAAYDIVWSEGEPPAGVDISPGIEPGVPARARPIADVQERLMRELRDHGRPFARIVNRVARIDRDSAAMRVTLTLEAGPRARFGPAEIEGLERLDPGFVRGKIPWNEGEEYNRSRVDSLRTSLLSLGLFDSVKIDTADEVGADGSLPVTVSLVEGDYRSVGAGVAYSTSEEFVLDVFWEHRNLFGAAEKLRLTGTVGTITQRVVADFRKPDFLRVDQDLIARSSFIFTDSDAFEEETFGNYLGLDRKLSERWHATAGGSFDISRITDSASTETVQLFGMPLTATRDNRDDVLNPTEGSVLGFELTPYAGHGAEPLAFALGRVSASGYLALDERRRVVMAARTRFASLAGEETPAIPANKRLYAGGGGSIRGFEFQKVGPLDSANDPVGGRSLFEVGFELRYRITDEIGIVPFVEGGQVWDGSVPDSSGELRWAAGLGLRYHTAIGPVRVDIAMPINRRKNVDDAFQLYFSLGQAF